MIDFQNKVLFKLSKINVDSIADNIAPLLVPGETGIGAYKAIRDYVAFTDKRIIAVNVQGVTGKKKDFTTLPYSKIQSFSVETSGTIDLDSELELYFSGLGRVKFEFTGSNDIVKIGQLISSFIL